MGFEYISEQRFAFLFAFLSNVCYYILNKMVTISTFIVTSKNLFQIGCADGIFAFRLMFSYGQRSKCADLLNSYIKCFNRIK